ncbi:MAG: RluA family pseudouridine synthase [Clostridia bacterium]|nr:RluA family pseudouridine synthase [Clostridia bacterium]
MKLSYIVTNPNYETIKQVIKEEFKISDRLLLKLKANQKIYRNSQVACVNQTIIKEDMIEVLLDIEEDNSNIISTKMDLSILYEDDGLLILNKPPFLPIHPSRMHYEDSLSNGVKYYFEQIGLKKKIRPINRLDKDTSGIVLFAKNEYIQENMVQQMKNHCFKKEYIAIVEGILEKKTSTIHLPIARKLGSIIERAVCFDGHGEEAITHYEVLKEISNTQSVVKVLLQTGRTHQIRVHFSYMGHPIIGDTLYGNESVYIKRQALHAYKVSFFHPITKQTLTIVCPLPSDMQKLIL